MAKQGTLENQVSLVKWAEQKEVKAAWEKIAEREGLQKDAFEHATWGFLDFMIGRSFELVIRYVEKYLALLISRWIGN